MEDLKNTAVKLNLWKEEDSDLGFAAGTQVRLRSAMTQEILSKYAPKALEYIPALLKLGP